MLFYMFYLFYYDRKVWDAVTGDDVLTLAHKHIVKSVNFTQVILDAESQMFTTTLNRHIRMISEGLCDTEEYQLLKIQIWVNYILRYNKIERLFLNLNSKFQKNGGIFNCNVSWMFLLYL